jgi:methionyl-tRNA formyltransferase
MEMRFVLLTGNDLRHKFVASRLAESVNLVGVVSEAKASTVGQPDLLSQADRDVIRSHFAERDEVERRLMGDHKNFPDTRVLQIENKAVNTPEAFDWVQSLAPDVVILYGTSIIKPPMLDFYEGRMINIHLGLSPYYRGSGTNFWPLVNREPECVGATIHLAVARVDAGAILAQVRPAAEAADRAHELGTKTIMETIDALPGVVSLYLGGEIAPKPQDLSLGRVFKNRDFNADAVRTMWGHLETGMMSEYLARAEARRRQYPIVELPDRSAREVRA